MKNAELIILAIVGIILIWNTSLNPLTFSGTGGLEGVTYKGVTIHGIVCPLDKLETTTASASWGGINGPLGSVITWIDTQGASTYPYTEPTALAGYCPTTTTTTTTTSTIITTTTTLCTGANCGMGVNSITPTVLGILILIAAAFYALKKRGKI
jgi:hypothetical protein